MSRHASRPGLTAEEAQLMPLYGRILGLRHVNPGGLLCFAFFEGAIALGLLLALAELVTWWGILILPVAVAVMVKINDVVAGAVARSAARIPDREQARYRREVEAAIGQARVPGGLPAEAGARPGAFVVDAGAPVRRA